MGERDPVHRDSVDGYWYFWNETWADRHGPYRSEEIARAAWQMYCQVFLDGKVTECPCCGRKIKPEEKRG